MTPICHIFSARGFQNSNPFPFNLYNVNRKVYEIEYKSRHVWFSSNRSSFRPSLMELFFLLCCCFSSPYLRLFLVISCLLYFSFNQSSNVPIETSGGFICHYPFFYTLLFSHLFYASHLPHFHLQISIKNIFSTIADSFRDVKHSLIISVQFLARWQ